MPATTNVAFSEALRVWLRIGLISFGGPAGQIALMHRLLVEERRWISESRFLHALNYCMLLPGPEAQQLATYVGWLLNGTRGGIAAGVLFVLPGWLLMLGISIVYVLYGDLHWVQGLLFGLQAATLAIVVDAVRRVGRKALGHRALYAIAAAAFVAIFLLRLPFPLIVLAAAVVGLLMHRRFPAIFGSGPPDADTGIDVVAPAPGWTLRVLLSGVLLWGAPLLLMALALGAQHVYTQQALFFSKMALVTFGGAYAVMAYMTQQAVERYGWLTPAEMVQGLALAETTPGPLILVLSYVGFLGAWRDPGALTPLTAGVLGSAISTWVSFVPCFLWIFLGAPHIERLRGHAQLNAALSAITAAVVGVILNLSIWFALHVLFAQVDQYTVAGLHWPLPRWASIDWAALLLSVAAAVALLQFRLRLLPTLAVCAVAGMLLKA